MAFLMKNEKNGTYNFPETVNKKVADADKKTRVLWMLQDSNRTLLPKYQ